MAKNSDVFIKRSHLHKPQINLALGTTTRIWLINLCAFLAILQSSFGDSFSSFFVALGALLGAVLTELLIFYRKGNLKAISDGSAVATALILTLLLPNNLSPVYSAAGAAFAIAVIKHSFGGLGSNWLNPAAGGWLFIRFSWPNAFRAALEDSAINQFDYMLYSAHSESFRSFFNRTVFSITGAQLPQGYLDLFISPYPGIIADRGILTLLAGTIILTSFRAINRSWIPALYLAFFIILIRIGSDLTNGDVFFALCTGGTLITAFFLAGDPVTGAKSNIGALLLALIGGALTFLYRYPGAEPYGAIFALVCINALLPLLRFLESKVLYSASLLKERP